MKILLVEPEFPIPPKSKNHKNFLPVGLLKIASYFQQKGNGVLLTRGYPKDFQELIKVETFDPDEIWITSLFTYWAEYVKDAVNKYRKLFPNSKIIVGGIYASLYSQDEVKEYTSCDEVLKGVFKEAEEYFPAYDLLNTQNPQPLDYQIIHTTRGCPRHCEFCGTWKIEPEFESKKTIKNLIKYKKIVFYDNNLLLNQYIENILNELINMKKDKKILWCESQSGFDGRVLLEKPFLAKMLKQAGFRYPRIAWDWGYDAYKKIEKQLEILIESGFQSKDISIFMIYNWDLPFKDMEKKRIKCWEWKVQISDCRYRPLNQLFDYYNPRIKGQTNNDYYIHEIAGWSDFLVKQFRKNVRRQNICVRQGLPFYSREFERKYFKDLIREVKNINNIDKKIKFLKTNNISYWLPQEVT